MHAYELTCLGKARAFKTIKEHHVYSFKVSEFAKFPLHEPWPMNKWVIQKYLHREMNAWGPFAINEESDVVPYQHL